MLLLHRVLPGLPSRVARTLVYAAALSRRGTDRKAGSRTRWLFTNN
jgi:hypothetical protein